MLVLVGIRLVEENHEFRRIEGGSVSEKIAGETATVGNGKFLDSSTARSFQ